MKAFFFGAGCSFGTLGSHAPAAAQFVSELGKYADKFPKLMQIVEHLKQARQDITLVSLWTCIDYYDKLCGALDRPSPWGKRGEAVPEMKQALLEIYGQRCDGMADGLPKSCDYTLGRLLLKEVENGDVLISFNYDTVVERLANRFGIALRRYCDEFRKDVITLVKPHGSTSWCLNLKQPSGVVHKAAEGGVLLDSMACVVRDEREPLVLGTVPIKSELLEEIQLHHRVHDVYKVIMHEWSAVVAAVRKADVFVVAARVNDPETLQHGI
jgi:hypothetical protein